MMKTASVRLREAGPLVTYKASEGINSNDYVILEADRGLDYGLVMDQVDVEAMQDIQDSAVKHILRKVTPEDMKVIQDNRIKARDALKLCSRKAKDYKLEMKMVNAEYSFDGKKIIFYFTSEGRIDFRELVKELAKVFKRRIEMRQIGVRDEAKLFGGVGPCGQSLCCVRFLKNFEPVSMKMAKAQHLPLSSNKISGICGRLMCCLFYEYKTYKDLSKGLPKDGQIMEVDGVKARAMSVNILKRTAYLQFEDGRSEKVTFDENGKPVKLEDKKNG
jgi:cell fate regulator YaaT (PSP1 superfamily)